MVNNINPGNPKCFAKTTSIMQITGLVVLLMFCSWVVNAQAPKPTDDSVPPEVTLAGTQLLHISSAITNKDYALYINLPGGYSDTTKTFPVLFLIDAQWDFQLMQAIYGSQYYDGF